MKLKLRKLLIKKAGECTNKWLKNLFVSQAIVIITFQPVLLPVAHAAESWTGDSWEGETWEGNPWSGESWQGENWEGNSTDRHESWTGQTWEGFPWYLQR